jgi:hypothetical protein
MGRVEVVAWGIVGVVLGYYVVKHFKVTGGRVI